MASPMFSVALNAFYLLLIRYRWQESDLYSLEKKVTFGIWTYALVLSIIPIPLEAYNYDWDICWIVPSPLDCSDEECTRGLIANKLEIFLFLRAHLDLHVFQRRLDGPPLSHRQGASRPIQGVSLQGGAVVKDDKRRSNR